MVAKGGDRRREEVKVNRRHLRAEYRVLLPLHLLREQNAVIGRRADGSLVVLPVTDAERGNQRSDADARCTEVIDLINFQYSIDFIGTGQDV